MQLTLPQPLNHAPFASAYHLRTLPRESELRVQIGSAMESWALGAPDYDPAFEWPGSGADSDFDAQNLSLPPSSQRQTCFRLVVKSSAVLARKKRVAVLDAYDEAQIGRDASTSEAAPRIRLKDMEVSKLHATLFWDRERKEWAVVDMGSKHGTYVKTDSGCIPSVGENHKQTSSGSLNFISSTADPAFARLSPPRQASIPRALRHLDELSIGRTVFIVHVHSAGVPCDDCHPGGELDIPLFSVTSGRRTQKPVEVARETSRVPCDARSAITLLKRSLLSRHPDDASKPLGGVPQLYIDRSAKRRALHPYSRLSSPPPGEPSRPATKLLPPTVNAPLEYLSRAPSASSSGASFDCDIGSSSAISAPPAPISDANVGHRLLERQGWVPGSTLGVLARSPSAFDKEERPPAGERMSLSEPLQLATNIGRKGLGMRTESSTHTTRTATVGSISTAGVGDWRAHSRRRGRDEVRRNVM